MEERHEYARWADHEALRAARVEGKLPPFYNDVRQYASFLETPPPDLSEFSDEECAPVV